MWLFEKDVTLVGRLHEKKFLWLQANMTDF